MGMQQYQNPGIPLVVQDMGSRMLTKNLTLTTIWATCGGKTLEPLYPTTQPKWGGLDQDDTVTLGEFLGRTAADEPEKQGYVFDWGLPRNCPKLLENFVFPSYMARNLLKIFPPELRAPGNNWPSLFIGKQ